MQKFCIYIFGIILLCLYSSYYDITKDLANIESIRVLGIFAYVQVAYIFISWRIIGNSWINAYTVFIIAYVLFSLGQPLLDVFSASTEDRSLLLRNDISFSCYYEAEYIALLFLMFFHFGALLSSTPKRTSNQIPSYVITAETTAINKISNLMALISAPFYVYKLIIWAAIASISGYHELYESEYMGISPIVMILGNLFIPSIIAKFVVSESKIGKSKIIWRLLAVCVIIIPNFYIGLRNEAVILIMAWVIIYCKYNKITFKIAILGLGVLYACLVLLNMIIVTRNDNTMGVDTYQENLEENPALSTITEMGFSMFTLCKTIDIVPAVEDWRMGTSYLFAPTIIIPNIGFWDIHPAQIHSNLGRWLTDKLGTTFGTGYSMNAEAYINFGYFGAIVIFLLGALYAKFFQQISSNRVQSPLKMLLAILFFWCIVASVRNSLSSSIRDFFFYVLPIYLLSKYIANYSQTRNLKE